MKNFAVTGCPVSHSRSPDVFRYFFKLTGLNYNYTRLSIVSVSELLNVMEKLDIEGLNVTSPFKEDAFRISVVKDDVSVRTRSVNTVIRKNGKIFGYNTDYHGVQSSVVSNKIHVKGKKCLILGAGGAGRSAAAALKDLGGEVYICNRTDERALRISREIGCRFISYSDVLQEIPDADLFVPAVTKLPDIFLPLMENIAVLDPSYKDPDLMKYCKNYTGGTDWLIYQAQRSFELFTGLKTGIDSLKDHLSGLSKIKNIAITGPTCAGKTTFGKLIAAHFGMRFYDSDEETENTEGKKIKDIFKIYGETHFRNAETASLERICRENNFIVSVGAGALEKKENRDLLSKHCFTVLLYNDAGNILKFLKKEDVDERPLLQCGDPASAMQRMLEERKQNYLNCADLVFIIGKGSVEQECKKLIRELDER